MTIDEKLDALFEQATKDARAEGKALLKEYQQSLDALFAEHVAERQMRDHQTLKEETAAIVRDTNREFSERQQEIRQKMAKIQDEIRMTMFTLVREKLEAFREQPEYAEYLVRKVSEIKAFAEGDEALVYIDPADAKYADLIEKRTGTRPVISEESFDGGVRAYITNRRVLIDNSMRTLTADAEEDYVWVGGGD